MDLHSNNEPTASQTFTDNADCYEANQAQQEEIEKTIKESGPLVSDVLPLSILDKDFAGHDVFLEKLIILKKRYSGMRRIRRDGNCFYRAFGFAYLEYLLTGKRKEEAQRFIRSCDACKDTLIANGYTQFTVEDFHEQFTGMVERFVLQDGQFSDLLDLFNNQSYSDYYVVFLRLLVSGYMQRHADFYQNFIDEEKTVRQFCETEVEPMGRDCDNVHIAALALAVEVPVFVENCQLSGELTKLQFPSHASTEEVTAGDHAASPVTLLYRPGHYDILYPNHLQHQQQL